MKITGCPLLVEVSRTEESPLQQQGVEKLAIPGEESLHSKKIHIWSQRVAEGKHCVKVFTKRGHVCLSWVRLHLGAGGDTGNRLWFGPAASHLGIIILLHAAFHIST